MPLRPLAFLSYAHIDDEYHGGAITEFRKQLSMAVRVVAGRDFDIFQDRDTIEWGQSWRETLDAALGEVRFLIPILTPSFFRSGECRNELQAFLEREAAVGRNDLVLSVHYITCPVLEDEAKQREDHLASMIARRQHRDWRTLRHEPFASPEVRRALEALALEIDRAMHRTIAPPRSAPTREAPEARREAEPARPHGAAPDDLSVIRDADFAPVLVVLPCGEFIMGSAPGDAQANDDEKPQHRVRIRDRLAVGRYPVTFAEWDRYAADAAWHRLRHMEPYRPEDNGWGRGTRPVINVSWVDVQGYLRWLGDKTGHRYRLPSEAEWEYACRAGTVTAYNIGPTLTHYDANFGNKLGKTVEVGSYTPNPWGLHDVHGNVWEWVEDCWNDSYKRAPDDGSAWTSGDCTSRVLRGGSWHFASRGARSACRGWGNIGDRHGDDGFRVARLLAR